MESSGLPASKSDNADSPTFSQDRVLQGPQVALKALLMLSWLIKLS